MNILKKLHTTLAAFTLFFSLQGGVFADDENTFAAKINGQIIFAEDINNALSSVLPSISDQKQKDVIIKRFLDEVIDQELVIQDAEKTSLSQQQDIKARIKNATRAAEANVYLNARKYSGVAVSAYDIDEFAKNHPEYLSGRRYFHYIQLQISPAKTSLDDVKKVYNEGGITKLVTWLRANDIGYSMFDGWLATEQITSASTREKLLKLKDNESVITEADESKQIEVLRLLQSQPAPVSLDEARLNIGRVLTNRNLQDAQKSYVHGLRSTADIEINKDIYSDSAAISKPPKSNANYATGLVKGSISATLLFLTMILVTKIFVNPDGPITKLNEKARAIIFVLSAFVLVPWFAWPIAKSIASNSSSSGLQSLAQVAITGLIAAIVLSLMFNRFNKIPPKLKNPWFWLVLLCIGKLAVN